MKKHLLTSLILMTSISAKAHENINYGEFDSFVYEVEGKCETLDDYIYFGYLSDKGFYDLETEDLENDYKASFDLYLQKDGTYALDYEVHKVIDYINGGYRYDVVFEKVFKGKVLTTPDKLILENLGELTILYDGLIKNSLLKFTAKKEMYIQNNMEVIFENISGTHSILDEQCK